MVYKVYESNGSLRILIHNLPRPFVFIIIEKRKPGTIILTHLDLVLNATSKYDQNMARVVVSLWLNGREDNMKFLIDIEAVVGKESDPGEALQVNVIGYCRRPFAGYKFMRGDRPVEHWKGNGVSGRPSALDRLAAFHAGMSTRSQDRFAFWASFFFDFMIEFPLSLGLHGNIAAFDKRGFIAKGIDFDSLVELGRGEQILKALRDSNDMEPAADHGPSIRLLFQARKADHAHHADILEIEDQRPVAMTERIKGPLELNRALPVQVAFQGQCCGLTVMDTLDPHPNFRPAQRSPTIELP